MSRTSNYSTLSAYHCGHSGRGTVEPYKRLVPESFTVDVEPERFTVDVEPERYQQSAQDVVYPVASSKPGVDVDVTTERFSDAASLDLHVYTMKGCGHCDNIKAALGCDDAGQSCKFPVTIKDIDQYRQEAEQAGFNGGVPFLYAKGYNGTKDKTFEGNPFGAGADILHELQILWGQ